MSLKCDTGPEARSWLSINAAPRGFAPNRFTTKDEAISYIDSLYALGAAKIFIPQDEIRDYPRLRAEVGGATCDSLVIELPKDEKRKQLILAYLQEAKNEGYDMDEAEAVIDETYLYLTWD